MCSYTKRNYWGITNCKITVNSIDTTPGGIPWDSTSNFSEFHGVLRNSVPKGF